MNDEASTHHSLALAVICASEALSKAIEEAVTAGLQVKGTIYTNDGEGLHLYGLSGEIDITVEKSEILAETEA